MPESSAKSHLVNNGKTVQSAWLAHWTGKSKNDHLTQISKSEGNELSDHNFKNHPTRVETASDNFGFSKGIKDVDLTMSLVKPSSQYFPSFQESGKLKEGVHAPGPQVSNEKLARDSNLSSQYLPSFQESGKLKEGVHASGPQVSNEKLARDFNVSSQYFLCFQASGKLKEGAHALGPQVSNEKLASNFNLETSSRECHLQPTEQVKYHMFFDESSYRTHEPENFRHLTAAFASSKPKAEKSEMPSFSRQHNTAVLKTDPSSSNHHSPALMEEQYKRMQKHIGMGFFPRQTGSPQQTLHHAQYPLQNVPHFDHDVEMARMPGGLHSFSRTTHSLLITKQTDVKVYQESQLFRESRASTPLKGKVFKELNYSHPHFGQSQQGVKLQLLDSSDHESQENAEDYRPPGDVQKNESSADTDTMDMESFKENRLSGVYLSPPNKDVIVESNLQKDKCRKRKIELPDINLEVSAQPAASSSTEKPEPGTSRTQSLDMNTLHVNLDQTTNSNECSNSNAGSDPESRWIKRLKVSETPSHGKLSRFFTAVRAMEGKPEPVLDKKHGKMPESLTGDSSSVETKHESNEITLSHSWIRRFSRKQNQKNPEPVGTSQPDNIKSDMEEEFQKKQFPSIAAMALMGKAMTGFRQFKLQKKESFLVWNTKTFD